MSKQTPSFFPHLMPGIARPAQAAFTLSLHTPDFSMLPSLRQNIQARLESCGISRECIGMALLAVSEVMTNLIKHPVRKASKAQVHLTYDRPFLHIDITDDASPFATFMAECNTAKEEQDIGENLRSGGYGLGCLLQISPDVHYTAATNSADGLNHMRLSITTSEQAQKPTLLASPPARTTQNLPLIYLIDDNHVTLDMHRQVLSRHYEVRTFEYAEAALAAFPDDTPALVICEVSLPDMDGLHLRQQLLHMEKGNETPFVFLSGQRARSKEHDFNLAGIDDFLTKPISEQRLLSVIARLLRRSAQLASAMHGSFDRKISSMLHPALPRTTQGWRLAMRSSQAEAGGGDFILHRQGRESLFAVVADVMGHSHDSKFFACAYAGYLRSFMQVLGEDVTIPVFMERLSHALHIDSFFQLTHMTCLAFRLMPHGHIELVTAGHPAPSLYAGADNKKHAMALDISGPLPGLTIDNRYDSCHLHLSTGDRLLVATDGYWNFEGRREAMHEVLENTSHLDLERAADRLWQAHIDYSTAGERHLDDTTLIILEAGENQT